MYSNTNMIICLSLAKLPIFLISTMRRLGYVSDFQLCSMEHLGSVDRAARIRKMFALPLFTPTSKPIFLQWKPHIHLEMVQTDVYYVYIIVD